MVAIYAEKPDMAKTIALALDSSAKRMKTYFLVHFKNEEYQVTWGFGHMCTICEAKDYAKSLVWNKSNYPFFPEPFKLKLKPGQGVKEQYNAVKQIFNQASYIINATDADQEGELIFYYLYQYMKCKTPWKRLWLHSTEKKTIVKSIDTLKSPNEVYNLTQAALCRSQGDWLVGCNATVYTTLLFGSLTTVGRVQTPTLSLLVSREKEIQNFKSTPFWTIKGEFSHNNQDYEGQIKKPEKFKTKKEAETVLQSTVNQPAVITDYNAATEKRNAPLLYDLNTLQQNANSAFGFSAKKTLDLAQSLYEKHYTTYPRTDCRYLPEDLMSTCYQVLDSFAGQYQVWAAKVKNRRQKVHSPYFDTKKVEGHYAIIPTDVNPTGLTSDENKLYDMVVKSFIRIFYPCAVLDKTTVTTTVNGYDFISAGSTIRDMGWFEVDAVPNTSGLLPVMQVNDTVDNKKIVMTEGKTVPPKRYTDKTLITAMMTCGKLVNDDELTKLMKDSGIGTPATRAGIIDGLEKKGYMERQGKQLVPTSFGINLIDNLPSDSLKTPEMTGLWEKEMEQVRTGKSTLKSFMDQITTDTKKICNEIDAIPKKNISTNQQINNSIGKCPLCGGDVAARNWGWGCNNYKSNGCKFGISNVIAKKKITENMATKLLAGKQVAAKGFTSAKKGSKFDASLVIENGKVIFKF